jgi:O-antigen/teichoic acid export membrane protein
MSLRQGGGSRTDGSTRPSRPLSRLKNLAPAAVVGSGGLALLAATVVLNGGNLAFNVVMSRLLGAARYGALGSIIGLLTVFTVLAQGAQLAVAQTLAGRLGAAPGRMSLRKPVGVAALAGLGGLVLLSFGVLSADRGLPAPEFASPRGAPRIRMGEPGASPRHWVSA